MRISAEGQGDGKDSPQVYRVLGVRLGSLDISKGAFAIFPSISVECTIS